MNLHNQSIHRFKYSRPALTPAPTYALPFDADIKLQIELEDLDGVTGTVSLDNIGFSSDVDTAATGFNTNNNQLLRHGRWKMENAYGPETQDLAVKSHAEYFTLQGTFEFNGDDACTAFTNAEISLNAGSSAVPVAVGTGTSNFSYNSPLVLDEEENFLLSAPGSSKTGDVSIAVDLTNHPWFQFDWNQDGTLEDHPAIKATFGQYRGHDRIIYWREVSN